MSEHLTAREAERYSRRALLPLELIETDAHLASCAACRQLLSEKEGAGAAVGHLRAVLRAEESAELEPPPTFSSPPTPTGNWTKLNERL